MILLVSHSDDPQGDAVARELSRFGSSYERIAPSALSAEALFSIDPGREAFAAGKLFASHRSRADEAASIGSVPWTAIYWRRPLPVEDRLTVTFPSSEELAKAEAYHAFRLAVESLPDSLFPLGHPAVMERASNKLLQLRLAREQGFSVPDTLVGNDPERLGSFLGSHEHVVVKPIHMHSVYRKDDRAHLDQALWCRGVDPEALRKRLRPDRPAQLMLQQRIVKKEDWRITMLPHRAICCRIDTSSLSGEQPDWRKSPRKFAHEIIELPDEIEGRLRRYLAAMGLKAGYFDFAVDEAGTPWFLEVNTNAEWLWIEELTGVPIAAEVARCLRGETG